jgi:hypothetical protein
MRAGCVPRYTEADVDTLDLANWNALHQSDFDISGTGVAQHWVGLVTKLLEQQQAGQCSIDNASPAFHRRAKLYC